MPNLPAASSLSHSKVTFKDSFILKAKQTLIYHTSLEHLTLSWISCRFENSDWINLTLHTFATFPRKQTTRGSRQEAAGQDGVEQPLGTPISQGGAHSLLHPHLRSWAGPGCPGCSAGVLGQECLGWKKAKEQELHIQKALDVITVQKSVQNSVIILALG